MADAYYEGVRNQIKQATQGGLEKSDIIWAVADAAATIIDGTTGMAIAGTVNSHLQAIYGAAMLRKGGDVMPNPWFVWNQHDEGESLATRAYLKKRGWLGVGSGVVAGVGAGVSMASQVDLGALLQHGNATGSTVAHLIKFKAIASASKQSQTISGWMDVIIKMKGMKAGLRGGQLAVAIASPIPFGGATAVSITAGLLASAAKLGIKAKFSNICVMTAMDLHWRAFQEQALIKGLSGGSGSGPATRILQELFIRRGATRVFGQHDVASFIHEPAGWMAISDKLLLM
ncbi:hypothetical protein [Chitinivorax sp. B]|uniref:hypothetical protein n=1 Tax=Chitinivorax sp. B TaxID=2502235 RepID=UPI0010F8557A|nr:hypothetical protein [Chitinivorax sp. B]